MRFQKTPSHISVILQGILKKAGFPHVMEEKKVRDNWSTLVGNRIAEIASVDSLQNGKLYLKVINPVWKMELNFQKDEIRKRVNKLLGGRLIKEVFFL
jgi:predicted nucleic acid-binding Zn ribbon protein